MTVSVSTLFSTASLVMVRSAGVAARTLSLLTLSAGMPAERFAPYATAFVLSELARCATDFGLDPVVLRRAEGLPLPEQRPMLRAALAIRGAHGLMAALLVLMLLISIFPLDVLLAVAGLQFLSQGLLQLGLNWRQVNNSAHRCAPLLLCLYATVVGLAALGYFHPAWGLVPLPLLLFGELAFAIILLTPLSAPRLADLRSGYATLVPQALPMAGIMLLAFVNTRADALIVNHFATPAEVGEYLYLARWVDLAPMLVTGVALPLVGKVGKMGGSDLRRRVLPLAIMGAGLAMVPFALMQVAALLNSVYAQDVVLRMLLACIATCRVALSVTTMLLLAQWRDRLLVRAVAASSVLVLALTWTMGAELGMHGIAIGVLISEAGNLLFQAGLLIRRPRSKQRVMSGNAHG